MLNKNPYLLILFIFFACCLCLTSCKSSKKTSAKKSSNSKSVKKKSDSKEGNKKESNKVDVIIKTARSYKGTKYKFGGTTRAGMDCSGLVCVSFQAVDMTLPRTSAQQSLKGTKVKISDIQEGDLVFFTDRKGRSKVTHVGIVTEVRGKEDIRFIHSSTKLGVVEDNLFADYYIKLFLKAVRIF